MRLSGQGVTVASREMAAYEAYLVGRITREQYLATDPRDVVVLNRDRAFLLARGTGAAGGMVRERQCLAGEVQRLTKLEEPDALRQLVRTKGNVAVPAVAVACRFTGSFDGDAPRGRRRHGLVSDYVSARHPDFVANPARAAQTVLTAIDEFMPPCWRGGIGTGGTQSTPCSALSWTTMA